MSTSQTSDPTTASTITLRNVLYVDEDQVDVLASQVLDRPGETADGGRSSGSNGRSGDHASTPRDGGRTAVEYNRRYRRVEEELEDVIDEPAELHHESIRNQMASGDVVRVSGPTFLEDYAMLSEIFERWIDIADALVSARVFEKYGFSGADELQRLRAEIEKLIEDTNDESKVATLKSQLNSLPSDFRTVFSKVANEMGMHDQEEWIEKHLALFNDLFHSDLAAFSVTRDEDEGVAFHAPLQDAHLRMGTGRLRALHNGSRLGEWTLVGRVTSVPAISDDSGVRDIEAGGGSEHMRDNFRGMIGPVQEIFESIYESKNTAEVVLRPIALYRDATLDRTP